MLELFVKNQILKPQGQEKHTKNISLIVPVISMGLGEFSFFFFFEVPKYLEIPTFVRR